MGERTYLLNRPVLIFEGPAFDHDSLPRSLPPPPEKKKKPKNKVISANERRRMIVLSLHRQGKSDVEIGAFINRDRATVAAALNQYEGVPRYAKLPPLEALLEADGTPPSMPTKGMTIRRKLTDEQIRSSATPRRHRSMLSAEMIEEAARLREQGLSYTAIASHFHCTKTPVRMALMRREEAIKARDMATAAAVISTGQVMNNPIPAPEPATSEPVVNHRTDEGMRTHTLDWGRRMSSWDFSPAPESCKVTKTRKHRATKRAKSDLTSVYSATATQGASRTNSKPRN